MKAVNLIPADERRGAGGAAGRTGGAAYILIGALVLVVGLLAAYATTNRSINDKRAQLARVEASAAASEAEAARLAPYSRFAALRTARVATVSAIAKSRFDWAHAMHELGRTLPRDITLTGLRGTVSNGVTVQGGPTVPLRTALDVPALELTGCAPGQASIPPMLASLRRIDGARRVSLQQSVYQASTSGAGSGDSGGVPPAPGARPSKPPKCDRQFQVAVFFDPKPAATAPAAAAPTAQATSAAAPVPAATGGAK